MNNKALASIAHFETFLTVAQTGSFTQAAKVLGSSKSSVSQIIRLLEKSFKLPLFIRTTRKVELTDEGRLLYEQCERIKHEVDAARDLICNFEQSPSGILKISSNPYFAKSRLISIIAKYSKLYPDVTIDLHVEERIPDHTHEQIDIIFGINWAPPLDIVARPIGNTRYVLCASPKYFKKYGKPTTLKDLVAHKCITHSGRRKDTILANLKKPLPFKICPYMKINDAEAMKTAALADIGIIQIHEYIVADELINGDLVEILSEYFEPDIPLYVYFRKHRYVQPKIRQFINLITGI